jgi:septal ring factor EnvC (AmiA/AmiB activator)
MEVSMFVSNFAVNLEKVVKEFTQTRNELVGTQNELVAVKVRLARSEQKSKDEIAEAKARWAQESKDKLAEEKARAEQELAEARAEIERLKRDR